MKTTAQKIPFLRISVAFAAGILLGAYTDPGNALLFGGSFMLLIALVILNRRYQYRLAPAVGALIHVLFILLGAFFYVSHNTKPVFFEKGSYVATVLEAPQEKPNSYQSVIEITTVQAGDSAFQTNEKVLVYFAQTEKAQNLKPGDVIVSDIVPEPVKNAGNPFEFDYKSYLERKKIYRRAYLGENNWELSGTSKKSAKTYAELWRESLLDIYRRQNLGENETEILSALTLGYKRGLDPETKRVFSSAGAMHVLAVSGLHVGIIYLVLVVALGFLRKQKAGRMIFVVFSIMVLWCYAFITGLSPSVMRASTMFTIIIIAENINRRANIYNSLAASALFLLLLNPNNLFEVGFQLSYSAVFGIVFLQPRLVKTWPVKNKLLKFFWDLLTVSIAAQVATFPITAYYFNQFPTYFWLTNLIVIPAVTVLIPLGIALLALAKIPILSSLLAFTVKWLIKTVYFFLGRIEAFPYSVSDVSLQVPELVFLLCFMFSAFLFISSHRPGHLKFSLVSILLLSVSVLSFNYRALNRREIIVYNHPANPAIHLVSGKQNYVISQNKIAPGDFLVRNIQSVTRNKRLADPVFLTRDDDYEDPFLYFSNGVISFEGKTLCFMTGIHEQDQIRPDYYIHPLVSKMPDTGHRKIITHRFLKAGKFAGRIYCLTEKGAFSEKW